jgi:hypothetical protein
VTTCGCRLSSLTLSHPATGHLWTDWHARPRAIDQGTKIDLAALLHEKKSQPTACHFWFSSTIAVDAPLEPLSSPTIPRLRQQRPRSNSMDFWRKVRYARVGNLSETHFYAFRPTDVDNVRHRTTTCTSTISQRTRILFDQ